MMEDYLAVGRIKRAVGLKGDVLIKAYSQVESIIQPGVFFLKDQKGTFHRYSIKHSRIKSPKDVICRIEGITDRTGAEAIEKQIVYQQKSLLPVTDDNEFYWYQLKGLLIHDKNLGEVGRIKAILETGANDVLVVEKAEGEVLIPLVEEFIENIDLEHGVVFVDLPPGLIDATFLKRRKN